MKTRCIILLTGLLFLYYSGTAQSDKATPRIEAIMRANPVIGVSVAAVKDGKLIYAHSFGFKNLEQKIPLTDESVFRIASISKSFSSTALMQLVQKKKLRLDDDVSKLLGFYVRNPKFPNTVITIRMLLSHTSSLSDKEGYFTLDVIDTSKNANWRQCYNDYEPGKGYQYCNLNYNLAGTIVERVSADRFDHYIRDHILMPLKIYGGFNVNDLDSTRFVTIYEYNPDSATYTPSPGAYASRKKEIENYVMGISTPIFSAAGGMKITASGLAKYMMMHMGNGKWNGARIISKKSERIMRKSVNEKAQYGLGLLTTKKLIPGVTLIGHTGSAYGLSSAMFFEPKEKFGFVVISNGLAQGYTDGYNTIIREVVLALYDSLIKVK